MPFIKGWIVVIFALSIFSSYAQTLDVPVQNKIESVSVENVEDGVVSRIKFQSPPNEIPKSFALENPPLISFDFPNTNNSAEGIKEIGKGGLTELQIIQAGTRTRVVFKMKALLPYEAKIENNDLLVYFRGGKSTSPPQVVSAPQTTQTSGVDEVTDKFSINKIDFKRGKLGEARVLVNLSNRKAVVDIKREGSALAINFQNTSLNADQRAKLDVTEFDTPVNAIQALSRGNTARIVIESKGLWEYSAYQADRDFVVEVRKIRENPYKLVQGTGGGYQGERLSLNFQNIAVRDLLQVLADFTGFNILTSPAVSGNLTLRLKDVPWDQALDIILQAKGLDKRKDGNVILVATQDEILANDRQLLDANKRIETLEPLRTETFQLNYQTAAQVKALLSGVGASANKSTQGSSQGGAQPGVATTQALLSQRGGIISDERTNKLIITDTQTKLEKIRKFLTDIDIAPQQVMIEARIVEASDSFNKNLGARLGLRQSQDGQFNLGKNAGYGIGGNLSYLQSNKQFGYVENTPDAITDTVFSGLNAPGVNGYNPGQIALSIFNKSLSRFINLELTAIQADGSGYTISNPRVVTANQVKAMVKQGVQIPYQSAESSGASNTQFLEAVLSLEVTPQIAPDGRIGMALIIKKNTQNVSLASTAGLALDANNISTEVTVENGGTVVIGGIFQEEESDVVTKVPLLGDIPVLGNLFKVTQRVKNRSELLVFITPRIIAKGAEF